MGLLTDRELDVAAASRGGTRRGTVRLVDGQLATIDPVPGRAPVPLVRATG